MDELALRFFPYPHFLRGEKREGLLLPWHVQCSRCDLYCTRTSPDGLQICPWGVNYRWATADLLIAGVVARDFPQQSPARSKALRLAGKDVTTRAAIETVARQAAEATEELEAERRADREAVISQYKASGAYQRELVELLKPEIRQALAQVHDYKQFVQQVLQNLDVILEPRLRNSPLEEKIEQVASQQEAAIYWAARLMDEKLDAALFYLEPERISSKRRRFRLHGAVTKIRKIYEPLVDAAGVEISDVGSTWSYIEGNPEAFSVIPHAFIDNAVKYAPAGTAIKLIFRESDNRVEFAVESEGPKIESAERERIFEPFVRGEAARLAHAGGMGFGLAQAQLVAREMGTEIDVRQHDGPESSGSYRTSFSVWFERQDPPVEADREDEEIRRRLDARRG